MIALLAILIGPFQTAYAQESLPVDISGQMFLAYQARNQDGLLSNDFTLKRGYLNIERQFSDILGVRFTQDITLDREGTDAGNIEMRLKYLYLHVNLHPLPFLQDAWIEAGMVSRPWLEFEEKINLYRVQGPHFIESMGVMTSADFGINFFTLIGGRLDEEQIGHHRYSYPGRFGSFSLGVFNGGGYYAIEENQNKTVETRLTLRPLPEAVTGLQVSYHLVAGRGNLPENPLFRLHHAALSYESKRVLLMAQGMAGTGNMAGTFLDPYGGSQAHRGFALFGELYLYRHILSVFGEYRYFEIDPVDPLPTTKWVGGISWHFLRRQKFLLDYEYLSTPLGTRRMVELAMEIRF
ncbi:MAG: hypothetical protein R6V75_01030 [Bacteroidales bacterium]